MKVLLPMVSLLWSGGLDRWSSMKTVTQDYRSNTSELVYAIAVTLPKEDRTKIPSSITVIYDIIVNE